MNNTVIWDFPAIRKLGERGEEIYREKYQADFEACYHGQVAAVDVYSEKAFVAPTMTEAGNNGHAECPDGFFYFVRVGFPAVYRLRR